MMYPPRKDLLEMLKANFSLEEAKIALAIPNKVIPFQGITAKEISISVDIPIKKLEKNLQDLSKRGLLFSKKKNGEIFYALQQVGFGFPQVFFWKGEETPHSKKMTKLTLKYFNTEVTKEAFSTTPIAFRFVPVDETIEPERATVLPFQVMSNIIQKAKIICVAQCICRVQMKIIGRECMHPKEVCMKFNDLAQFMIENGFGREVSKEEALEISKKAEESGLVHFTDNAIDNVQQNCNCCSCSCWSLGRIKRRKIPRDELMATYFIRETLSDKCIGCGSCVEICPADVIEIIDDKAVVDKDWCVGCGICVSKCPSDAIKIVMRNDLENKKPEENFKVLHEKILKTRK